VAAEDTMMNPPVENLMERTHSKFALVTLAARRAREINSYFNQLGEGLGTMVPPQVSSVSRKPLSISFEEIAADKIQSVPMAVYDELEAEQDAAMLEEAAASLEAGLNDLPSGDHVLPSGDHVLPSGDHDIVEESTESVEASANDDAGISEPETQAD
jgi:DNA-directed RNA polymerase subunit omega